MKTVSIAVCWILMCASNVWGDAHPKPLLLFNVQAGRELPLDEAIDQMVASRLVLVGEHHSVQSHHEAQLSVIQVLGESGKDVAIGFEMFRSNATHYLDAWVNRKLSEGEFKAIYFDNWNFPWPLYRMLFVHARDTGIPMIGLNVPRDVTRQVAKQGFKSLNEAQRGSLPMVTCEVDEAYMEFIRNAHGAHGHGGMNFTYFCEAQLVWDKAMAINAVQYLETNPGKTMVLVAGTGHVRKGGIPTRIREFSRMQHTVILPEVPGSIERGNITTDEADFLILGLQ